MRKCLFLLIGAALLPQAHASILLFTPYCITGPAGVAVACATSATATAKTFNWVTNTACITYSFGSVTSCRRHRHKLCC